MSQNPPNTVAPLPASKDPSGSDDGVLARFASWGASVAHMEFVFPEFTSFSWYGSPSSNRQHHDAAHVVLVLLPLLLFLLVLWRCFGRRRKPKSARRDSLFGVAGYSPTAARGRAGSLDAASPTQRNRPRATSSGDFDLAAAARGEQRAGLSSAAGEGLFPVVMGPLVGKLVYSTHTPPLTWSEASKKLLPKDTKIRSEKRLVLDIPNRTLTTHGANTRDHRVQSTAVEDISLHVKAPVEGAVLEFYVKSEPKEEWTEHTFPTALDAAQFQYDLLGCQVLGASIQHMYDALEVVHKGSLAHDGKECLLHNCEKDEKIKKGSVAWDDAMRCFSGLSSVRSALERQLTGSIMLLATEEEETNGEEPAMAAEYAEKRHMLGPVDFFRLFVPLLPPTSFPQEESNPQRMEQLLRTRKLVAEAAVLVRGFAEARVVCNQGWKLTSGDLPDGYLSRRLAFDTSPDNVDRDSSASNEYYEATVSRDVHCTVHSRRHLKSPGASCPSSYQAYSLVGSHVFRLPPEGQDHPLTHTEDPVEALPSLRRIVETHPHLDFFACAFFPEGIRVAFVHFFVRSLPKGVDVKFDTIMDRFVNGSTEVRNRKLEVFIQLGPGSKLSPLAWAALKAVSMVLGWTRKGEAEIPVQSGADCTPFPGMTLSNYTQTNHFGGSLRADPTLPSNYVSVTSHVDASRLPNVAMPSLYRCVEEGALSTSVVDFTFVLEGQRGDELPERALGSIRLVRVDPVQIGLPTCHSAVTRIEASSQVVSFLPEIVQAPLSSDARSSSAVSTSEASAPEPSRHRGDKDTDYVADSAIGNGHSRQSDETDLFKEGVDSLEDILQGVLVPVRSDRRTVDNGSGDEPKSVPVLKLMTRNDLKRYFIAAECRLKAAAVRVVNSAAWRGQTFPISVHECRVELQSGQFFQQGYDLEGHPTFYFQNMCLGPWRKDSNAMISAILHRLDSGLRREKETVKCTVIINVGKPVRKSSKPKKKKTDEDTATNADDTRATTTVAVDEADTTKSSVNTETTSASTWNPFCKGANPRLDPSETYRVHSSDEVISQLVDILHDHYPERLHKALILPGDVLTGMSASLTVRSYVSSTRTRSKVIVVNRASELGQHVSKSELSSIVGGLAPVPQSAFECI